MSGRYQVYDEFASTDEVIIEDFPQHWDLTRIKFNSLVKARVGWHGLKSEDFTEEGPYLVTGSDFKGKYIQWRDCYHCDEERYQQDSYIQLKDGDLLLTKDGTIGKVALVSELDGKATLNSGVFVVRPLKDGEFTTKYYYWLLLSRSFTDFVDFYKIGSTIVHLYQETFVNFKYALPPLAEQQKIANFLDHETAKIDTLIAKQEKLIALLKEKRQAVISHAVTRGLNPDAPMKDSGVEWLGEVPEHWEVTRAKFVSNIFVPQRNKPELNEINDGISWATMDDMKSEYINKTRLSVSNKAFQVAGSKVLPKNSVIASCVGNFGIASISKIDLIINQQLQAFIPFNINSSYLKEIIYISKCYFELIGTAATLVYVNQQGFENLPILLPSKEEQFEISKYIDQQRDKFELLINKCEEQIKLMKERKAALISAAVTGKIDVRNWQEQ